MANSFTMEAFTLLGVGVFVIGLRTASRITSVGVKNFRPDDYLMLLAAVIYSLETATAYAVGAWWHGLANNGMTDEQRRALSPESPEFAMRVGGSKTQLVGWSLYTLLLWTLKLCMCIFYSRLTAGVENMTIRVRIGYGAIGVTYVATILSILLGCQPFHRNWQILPDPGNYCQPAISRIDLYVTVVLNVLTDIYLLSIPLPMFWTANLPTTRKYLLIILFSGGIFVMAAGILRCALIIQDPIGGAQAAGSWACRETFVAVIVNNIPIIYPLYRRMLKQVTSSSLFSKYKFSTGGTDSRSYELKGSSSRGRSDKGGGIAFGGFGPPRRLAGPRSVNPLPTTIANDSDEHIIQVVPSREPSPQQSIRGGGGSDAATKGGGIRVTKEAKVSVSTLDPAEHDRRQGSGGSASDRSAAVPPRGGLHMSTGNPATAGLRGEWFGYRPDVGFMGAGGEPYGGNSSSVSGYNVDARAASPGPGRAM